MVETLKTFIDSIAGETFTKLLAQGNSESDYLNTIFFLFFWIYYPLIYYSNLVNQAILRIKRSSGLLYYYKVTI
jgi:hypothetical protein